MKKICLTLFSTLICIMFFCSCNKVCTEHTYGEWLQYPEGHYRPYTCGCPQTEILDKHIDEDNNGICDTCDYIILTQVGVILQITQPLDNEIISQEFSHKNNLIDFINNNYTECSYFYVFEDENKSEPTSNLMNSKDFYSYNTLVELPANYWLIIHNIYTTNGDKFLIKASFPMTTNIQSPIYYTFGEKWSYNIEINISLNN